MFLSLMRSVQGVVRVEMTGLKPERFLNLCSLGGIEVRDLSYGDGVYSFSMSLPEFWKIRAFARKSKVRLKVVKRAGLPFFMQKNRKRKLYFAGLAFFFVMLYAMSLFIWDISFSGNYRHTDDMLSSFLEEREVVCGVYKGRIQCEELESAIRARFPEITWVSARVSGTRLYIQIKENEVISELPQEDTSPCDLVADFSGTITSMVVRTGVPMVSVGDEVEEGQILVSGAVPVTDDSDQVIRTNLVRADADITARSSGAYRQSFPLLHSVTVDTGKVRQGFFVKAGPFTFRFLLPGDEDSIWRTASEERQFKLFSDFYLPFWWGEIRSSECISYERYYTEEELEEKGNAIHQIFLKNLQEKGVHIIENNVKILKDASLCHVEGTFVTEASVVRRQSIEVSHRAEHSGSLN